MTVAEIRAKLPLAETYELSRDKRYLIVVDPAQINLSVLGALIQELEKAGIKAVAISSFQSSGLKVFDMEAPDHP